MNKIFIALAAVVALSVGSASAGTVDFQDNGSFVDIFLTPSAGSEFTNFDLIVTPTTGSLVDPDVLNAGSFDRTLSRVDTWVNTAFSSLDAGDPSIIFTSYHPGAPPFTPTDNPPTAGADDSPQNPSTLNWSVFDTAVGDTDQFGPYHVGRVAYSAGGAGNIEVLAFDTITSATGGETFNTTYGGGGMMDPIAVGDPTDGTLIDLTPEFLDSTGLREDAIALSNGGGGTLEIISVTPTNNNVPGLFGATFDGLNIDLTVDVPTGQGQPVGTLATGSLLVETNGGNLTYDLQATVPEPSTLGLIGLAMVGLLGARRS